MTTKVRAAFFAMIAIAGWLVWLLLSTAPTIGGLA